MLDAVTTSRLAAAPDEQTLARRKRRWSLDQLRTDPAASQAMIGGGKLGDQLSAAILFNVSQTQAGQVTLTGASAKTGSTARDLEPRLAALLGALMASSGTPGTQIDHIALSPTGGTHAAMHLATLAATGALDGFSGAQIAQASSQLRRMGMLGGNYAYYHNTPRGKWLVLGVEATRVLMRLATGREMNPKEARSAVSTLRHELQHAVTPRGVSRAAERVGWMEESTASLLAGWPGQQQHTAQALGVSAPLGDLDDMDPYLAGTRVLRQLVAWSGIDVNAPDSYETAFRLLQSKGVEHVPSALATKIGQAHKLSGRQVQALRSAIESLNGANTQARKRLVVLAKRFQLPIDDRL